MKTITSVKCFLVPQNTAGKNSPWHYVLYLSCLLTSNFVILLSYVYLVLLLTSGNKKSYGN